MCTSLRSDVVSRQSDEYRDHAYYYYSDTSFSLRPPGPQSEEEGWEKGSGVMKGSGVVKGWRE